MEESDVEGVEQPRVDGTPLISVAIYVKGDQLEPAEITSLIGVQPDEAFSKGDPWLSPASGLHHRLTGLWSLRLDDPPSVLDAILSLATKVGSRSLARLPHVDEAYVDVYVGSVASELVSFEMDAGCIETLSRLELPVRVTIG